MLMIKQKQRPQNRLTRSQAGLVMRSSDCSSRQQTTASFNLLVRVEVVTKMTIFQTACWLHLRQMVVKNLKTFACMNKLLIISCTTCYILLFVASQQKINMFEQRTIVTTKNIFVRDTTSFNKVTPLQQSPEDWSQRRIANKISHLGQYCIQKIFYFVWSHCSFIIDLYKNLFCKFIFGLVIVLIRMIGNSLNHHL